MLYGRECIWNLIHVLSVKNVFCGFSYQTFKELLLGMLLALFFLKLYVYLCGNTPEQIKIINYHIHYQVLRSKSWVHISAIY